ncbi:phosphoglycerate mutase [Luteibacter jiangsuensis]|uniref:Phosphoglycerate mutase n=1 Tax=Luteibacter jiangsuensis TaxID=637577 RepID=A0ABX0Q8J9_9GAMM|nr:phosphoglycerate mutase [Luteibacter jiangsuensis]NID06864.1 phosphoglycerate mutase [Luteibacter jiangsuensis]
MGSVLHVLLPGRAKLAGTAGFADWLARGSRLPAGMPGYLAALAEHFRWPRGPLPAAALIRQSVAGDAGTSLWLSADPAWVQPELNGARLLACGNLGLSMADADSLVAALAETFEAEGMQLVVGDAQHWQLRVPAYVDVPSFPEPEDALGADLFEHLPKGEEGRRWRALINEAQIVLHNHPVNRTRVAQGLPPVNSVWLWGPGALPDWVETGLTRIYSDDLLEWALAHRAGVDIQPRGPLVGAAMAASKPRDIAFEAAAAVGLLDLQDVQPSDFASDWWPFIEARLLAGTEIRLAFADGTRTVLHKRHRLRFWRKA